MTGIAIALRDQGHDVRWYTSKIYKEKLNNLGIFHYQFKKALEANQFNIDEVFPERKKLKAGSPQLKFRFEASFYLQGTGIFEDISEIMARLSV
jgi:UDP:flavonoid glycosyltransferase YjiC (YdhE family)